ncbi:Fc.00g026620.m01.CDS01 [Cosmosporella sp. VM-42]
MAVPGPLLGPLTEKWSQPASCSIYFPRCTTCDYGWYAQRCTSVFGESTGQWGHFEDDPDCWPPRSQGVQDRSRPLDGWGYYSPGLECPVGYTTGCSATYKGEQDWAIQFALRPGETAVGCCPEGYVCTTIKEARLNTCMAFASRSTLIPTASCDGTEPINSKDVLFPDVVTATTTGANGDVDSQVLTRTMTLYAPLFQLVFQPTDLPATETSATTSTDVSATTSTGSAAAETSSSKSDSGMSTGAKIGIGVGVGLGAVILLAALAGWFLWRKRSKANSAAELGTSEDRLAAESKQTPSQGHISAISELSPVTRPVELPASQY